MGTIDKPLGLCKRDHSGRTTLRVPFGLKDGRMCAPRQVPTGRACGCTCPACGGALIAKAKDSKRRRPHFAHDRNANCRAGYETAVHLKAKQLIAEEGRLWLPDWDGDDDMPNPPQLKDAFGFVLTGRRVEFPRRQAVLTDVVLEAFRHDYIPDVAARDEQGELLIEVRVTHAVDDRKRLRVQSEGRRMIEIDLSRLSHDQVYDEEAFRHCVLEDLKLRHWLSCPDATDAWRASLSDLKQALADRNRELAAQREREAKARRQAEQLRQQALVDAQRKQEWHERFREQRRARYRRQLELLPELVAPSRVVALMDEYMQDAIPEMERLLAPVPEERRALLIAHHSNAWIYGVHPALWQAATYHHFIHGQPPGTHFNQRDVARWVLRCFPKEQALYDLFIAQYAARADAQKAGYQKRRISNWAFTREENRLVPDFYVPINHFVQRLTIAGVLREEDGIGNVSTA